MTNKEEKNLPIYSETVIEFVTVAAEYCASLEQCRNKKMRSFLERMTKIAPLLYLKTSLLPELINTFGDGLQSFVTEMDYEQTRQNIAEVMGEYDSYLETQVQDMQYSENAIAATISENLADIYQELKDMIQNFQTANIDVMNEALTNCKENFGYSWGQKLLNTLSAMHNVLYAATTDFDDFDEDGILDKTDNDADI